MGGIGEVNQRREGGREGGRELKLNLGEVITHLATNERRGGQVCERPPRDLPDTHVKPDLRTLPFCKIVSYHDPTGVPATPSPGDVVVVVMVASGSEG